MYHNPEASLIGFGKAMYNTTVNSAEFVASAMQDVMLPGSSALFTPPQIPLMQIQGNQTYGAQFFSWASGGAMMASGIGALSDAALVGRLGVFGEGAGVSGAEGTSLFRTGGLSAEEANVPFVEGGMKGPYASGSRARIIQLQHDRDFVRVYNENKYAAGQWMMRSKEIEGLTPEQIQDKFALPVTPTHIADVHLPSGSYLQLGTTAPQVGWGSGGAIQYQSLLRVDESWFTNKQLLQDYLQQTPNMGMH